MPTENENITNPTEQPAATQAASETPAAPASWDEYINGQPEQVKTLYQQHVTGLQNAVKATRQERDDFAKQVRELLPKVEKGSDLEKQLTDFTAKLEAAERRAAFAEDAIKPEIGCSNIKAAWLVASADNLFDRKGAPDWAAIKAVLPEAFRKPSPPPGHPGAGTGNPPAKVDMNQLLRQATGR